jgi:hypothetical protein
MLWRKERGEVNVTRGQTKEDVMAQAIIVILKDTNERQVFQNAIAETAGNRLRIYRQADPRGLAERPWVAEFVLDEVQSWFGMSDAHGYVTIFPGKHADDSPP